MIQLIKQKPLLSFFLLTFLISWAVSFPVVFIPAWPEILLFSMSFVPAIAAIIIVSITGKKPAVLTLLQSLKQWRVAWYWYLIVFFGPAVTMLVTIFVFQTIGMLPNGASFPLSNLSWNHLFFLVGILFYQIVIVWGEELGWRGYALPALQKKIHPILAAVVLGVIWGIWHLPYFFIPGSQHENMSLIFFIVSTVGYSLIYTWIFNGSKGSTLIMSLFHAANNTTVSFTMMFVPQILDEPVITLCILGLFDLLIIAISGTKLLYKPGDPALR